MILFHDMVEILALPESESCLVSPVVPLNRRGVAATLVNRNRLRQPLVPNSLASDRLGCGALSIGGQQKVNGVALFIHGAIEVDPFPFNFHIGFVHAPAPAHRALPLAERLLTLRRVLDDPAVERGVIDGATPLAPPLLELPVGNRLRPIPPYAPEDNLPLVLTAFEVDHAASPPPHIQRRNIAEFSSKEKLRQNQNNSWVS
jgi:hypothetical protein